MAETFYDRSAYPPLSGVLLPYDEFLRRNTGTAPLKIQASRAQQALPTPGVRIRIIGHFSDARVLFFDGVTDEDGLIENILLPAAPRGISLEPGGGRGALYQVFAHHPDFEPAGYEVEMFEGIGAVLPVILQLRQEVL